jgi:hypothetical protein
LEKDVGISVSLLRWLFYPNRYTWTLIRQYAGLFRLTVPSNSHLN